MKKPYKKSFKYETSLERLKDTVQDSFGSKQEIFRWTRRAYKKLRELGFAHIAKGSFIKGQFRALIRCVNCSEDSSMGMIRFMGPADPEKKRNLRDYPNMKMVVLNKYGKICKIPLKDWDPSRKCRRVSQQ